jgi:hypothetical protein
MPITTELKDPQSKSSRWLRAHFDLETLAASLGADAEGADTLRPERVFKDYPWSTVGHAIEFRLRQIRGVPYFGTSASSAPVGSSPILSQLFHDALALLWDKYQSHSTTTREDAWVMYYAGIAEGAYRSGDTNGLQDAKRVFERLLYSPDWQAVVKHMAALRSGEVVEVDHRDHPCLGALVELLPVHDHVLNDIALTSDTATVPWMQITRGSFFDSPQFGGAPLVGGADGDFIVDRTLFDIKCTIHPERLWLPALRQMIAYVALDTDDEFEIDQIAIFLPRQHGAVARLSLNEILARSSFVTRREVQESLAMYLS